MTVWESDYASVAPLTEVISRLGKAERWSRGYVLISIPRDRRRDGADRNRDMRTPAVAIRVLHEKSMKVTFQAIAIIFIRALVLISAPNNTRHNGLPTGVAHPCDMDCPKWRFIRHSRRPRVWAPRPVAAFRSRQRDGYGKKPMKIHVHLCQ